MIRAILAGERDALKLAQMKHPLVKASTQQIVKALEGDYQTEHLFSLQTAVEPYDVYQLKITECENKTGQQLEQFDGKLDLRASPRAKRTFDLKVRSAQVRLQLQHQAHLSSVCGVDLTRLPGLSTTRLGIHHLRNGLGHELLERRKAPLFLA